MAGFGVLGGLVAVLISLAPIYLADYQLREYMKTLVRQSVSDDVIRERTAQKAHDLSLPVSAGEISVSHPSGKRKLEAKYIVGKNLAVLHFHPQAER